jgi:16S rRNA (adenine1518-N6/adenine1519-N6)-dimethyltransferase
MKAFEEFDSIPKLLKRYGLRPSKGLGQNFLADPTALQRVITAAEVGPEDTVLEIGPGLGSLTRLLAIEAARVVAVEIDIKLIDALEDLMQPFPNVELIHADILEVDIGELFPRGNYLVAANIPYYITSALLRHLLEAPNPPSRLILTVQKEVAERICAQAGDLSLMALSVQVYGNPKIAAKIPAGAFYPAPKVDSAVVRIDLFPEPLVESDRLDDFFRLIKAGFSQKRKTLRNAVSAGMGWSKEETEQLLVGAGIDPQRRAQTLSIEEWKTLVDKLK